LGLKRLGTVLRNRSNRNSMFYRSSSPDKRPRPPLPPSPHSLRNDSQKQSLSVPGTPTAENDSPAHVPPQSNGERPPSSPGLASPPPSSGGPPSVTITSEEVRLTPVWPRRVADEHSLAQTQKGIQYLHQCMILSHQYPMMARTSEFKQPALVGTEADRTTGNRSLSLRWRSRMMSSVRRKKRRMPLFQKWPILYELYAPQFSLMFMLSDKRSKTQFLVKPVVGGMCGIRCFSLTRLS
jgi:hypothetical protein